MRTILICPDPALREQFEKAAAAQPTIEISKALNYFPPVDELRRLMRVWSPDAVLLSMEDMTAVEALGRQLEAEFPFIQRIAITKDEQPATLRAALRLRMAELLAPPFDATVLESLTEEVKRQQALRPEGESIRHHFCAFLPAKGGVGASTVASTVASSLGTLPDASVLLADFDFFSGVTGFLFNIQHEFGMCDAANVSKSLDDETWQRLIRKSGNLDLLLSGAPSTSFDNKVKEVHLTPILEFAHRNYSVVCADLPDAFDELSLAVMREASRLFVVTTPDLASLRMARLKANLLQRLDWTDKACLVVNRVTKSMELSVAEMEKTVGLPLYATFPNEYVDVTRAAREGNPSPKLAGAAREFAEKLLKKKFEEKRARFIERFAVVPARYSFK